MSHAYKDLSPHEAMYNTHRHRTAHAVTKAIQAAAHAMSNEAVLDANLDALKLDPSLWRAFRRQMDMATAPITEIAGTMYADAAARLIAAEHSHLSTHKRSPLLPFRHRGHWTGWAIRFRHRNPGDPAQTGDLAWAVTHVTARPEPTERGARFYDGNKMRGHIEVSELVPGHGMLNLVCDCGLKYFDDIPLHTVMLDAARDLSRDTPLNADGRIYLRLPL